MSVFGEPIDHDHYRVPPFRLRESFYEVHANFLPNVVWDGKGLQQSGVRLVVDFISNASNTVFHHVFHFLLESGPIKTLLDSPVGVLLPGVSP